MMSGSSHASEDLTFLARRVLSLLQERQPLHIEGIASALHDIPPFIEEQLWESLGTALEVREDSSSSAVPGDRWISLRCSGMGFRKLVGSLREKKVLHPGWSEALSSIMVDCTRTLMRRFSARCGFTHSDEITVLIPPANEVMGPEQAYLCNLQVQKLCSLAASTVTAKFNYELMRLFSELYMEIELGHLATFDCRVGMYDTEEEAVSMILWRAYECGESGVSDAVLHCVDHIDGAEDAMNFSTEKKLLWLNRHSQLPLHRHQREGTYLVRRKRMVLAQDKQTSERYVRIRSRIEPVPGNPLRLCQLGELFPEDSMQLPVGAEGVQLREQNEDLTSMETTSTSASSASL